MTEFAPPPQRDLPRAAHARIRAHLLRRAAGNPRWPTARRWAPALAGLATAAVLVVAVTVGPTGRSAVPGAPPTAPPTAVPQAAPPGPMPPLSEVPGAVGARAVQLAAACAAVMATFAEAPGQALSIAPGATPYLLNHLDHAGGETTVILLDGRVLRCARVAPGSLQPTGILAGRLAPDPDPVPAFGWLPAPVLAARVTPYSAHPVGPSTYSVQVGLAARGIRTVRGTWRGGRVVDAPVVNGTFILRWDLGADRGAVDWPTLTGVDQSGHEVGGVVTAPCATAPDGSLAWSRTAPAPGGCAPAYPWW
ncbi:hypothetical protein R8Z50_15795 [Longispora sp. K20-0274]|uniref:hypothetical protein n=1 Tax=Longispora sp. K20-0274 TaxID=3088255 RepID=UPI00399B456C